MKQQLELGILWHQWEGDELPSRSRGIFLPVLVAVFVVILLMQAGPALAQPPVPVIYPDGGTFTSAQSVTISNIPSGDIVYYTTDGSNPETSSTRTAYTEAFTVYQSETIQAVDYDQSEGWGSVASAYFTIEGSSTLETPVISPDGGTYTTAQTVTIGDIYGTAYYTTDGSNPETSSTRITYTGPFTVYQSETIQAVSSSSAGWSNAASAYFNINGSGSNQAPILYPDGGTFTSAQSVTISNIPSGDSAYYTTDGSNPETSSTRTSYTGPFTVYQSETIQAVNYNQSEGWGGMTSAYFTIGGSSTLETPVISPDGGTFATDQTVTIGDIYGTAYYTTDGSNPETSSTRIAYTGPFTVYQSETIQAVSYSSAGWSSVTSAYFNINGSGSNQAPILYPDGGSFTSAQNVTIGNIPAGDTAYYTFDGSSPMNSITRTAYAGVLTVGQSETIQAVNYSPSAGWSSVTSAVFYIGGSSDTWDAGHLSGRRHLRHRPDRDHRRHLRHRLLHHRRVEPGDQQHPYRLRRAVHRQPVRDNPGRQLQLRRLDRRDLGLL